jgi:hypothetical protein
MKNLSFSFILVLIFSAYVVSNNVNAQQTPPPCTPDCEATPFFAPPVFNDFYFDNGCIIRVYYTWRHACNTWYDVQIVRIETLNPLCNAYSDKQLLDSAFKKVLEFNRMGYPPAPGNCDLNWRITTASCWSTWTIIVTGQEFKVLLPCTGAGCCYQPYQVCRDLANKITITPLGEPWAAVNCSSAIPPTYPPGLTCQSICEWLWIDDYHPGLIKPNEDGTQNLPASTIQINTYANGESLELLVNSVEKGNFTIIIADVYGKSFLKESGVVENSSTPINIDTSKLISGNYIYDVYMNGNLLYSGKLSIVK